MRVYELAKEWNKTSQDLLQILEDLGYSVKGYLSQLTEEQVRAVTAILLKESPESAPPAPVYVSPKPVQSAPIIPEVVHPPKEPDKEAIKEEKVSKIEKQIEKPIEKKPDKIATKPYKKEPYRRQEPSKKAPLVAVKPKKPVPEEVEAPKGPQPYTLYRLSKMLQLSILETEIKLIKMGILTRSIKDVIPGFAIKKLIDLFGLKQDLTLDTALDNKVYTPRSPVITVMGHVDHGKTTLLDAIRKAHIADKELGGITQAIGAYSVEVQGRKIVFIDTPGHEAFTAMRAKGSEITDIVILVVAADEGVKEQTIEAINHAKAARVPIIVALNKIDRPGVNFDLVKSQLTEKGLAPEEWGGDTIYVPISAKNKTGIDELLEMVLLKADLMELITNQKTQFAATVIESNITKSFGAQATIVVQTGTLKVGDVISDGVTEFKVKALYDDALKPIKSQAALAPVHIQGLPAILKPGSLLKLRKDYELSRQNQLDADVPKTEVSQEEWEDTFFTEASKATNFNVIIKADGEGTLDAVAVALSKIAIPDISLKIIHKGVGIVTDNDILLAGVSHARVLGFNVTVAASARKEALVKDIYIKTYRIIFDLIDDVTRMMKGTLEPEQVEEVMGLAEVKAIFKVPKAGTIAGCIVRNGTVSRNGNVRIIRDRSIIFDTKIASLRRFKEDVKEVKEGFECGIGLENFNDIKVGDELEIYRLKEVK